MTENGPPELRATGHTTSQMFEILEASGDDVVAVRMHDGTSAGYREFYNMLVEKTNDYGSVHVYEETTGWSMATYLSHLHGILPDLRTGPKFDIGRYAAVGDSRWAKLLYHQWDVIAPVWPVAPDEMRYYDQSRRKRALDWVRAATSTKSSQ